MTVCDYCGLPDPGPEHRAHAPLLCSETPRRRTIDTVLGPLKMIPECKAQAVCVNGLKCWEAGHCLRAPAMQRNEQQT